MNCRWNGSEQPRIIPGRHGDDCDGDECAGCQPCLEPHCRVCNRTHADGTCAECLALTREDLALVAEMCGALPEEVIHRGIESEAMTLLGPTADPEAWGHLTASVKVGRLPADYIAEGRGELHPATVLGTWDMCWRAELDHDEPETSGHIAEYVSYLDRQMTYMATYEESPFEDFARDLRRCRAHLEAVLHDGEQHDKGAPCMNCGALLERAWDFSGVGRDGWRCPRCRQSSTEDQYRFAVMHLHREEAEWLTDRDMEIRTGIKAGTVRVWANREEVKRKRDSGRTLYLVADVIRRAERRSA